MSDSLGPLTYGRGQEEVFLGRDYTHIQDYSERTATMIDNAIREIIETAESTAERILTEQGDRLQKLATTLVERESLDGLEIDELLGLAPQPNGTKETAGQSTTRESSRE